MPVGLFPRETSDLLSVPTGEGGTSAPVEPGFFAGFHPLDRIGSGLAEAGTEAAFALTPDRPSANVGMPPIGAPDWAYEKYAESIKKAQEVDPEEYRQKLAKDTTEVLNSFKADPHTVGFAGQTLQGMTSSISQFIAGSALAGPVGGAIVVGGAKGKASERELTAQGIDENTANAIGAANALFAGGSSLLPGGYGKTLLSRLTTGASANALSGIYQRGLTHNVLDDAGYTAQAAQYRALDANAIMADAVLGTGFGAMHHLFTPSVQDAARTIQDADHIETSTPGGAIPITPMDRDAHVANMTAAAEALLRGDDQPPNLQDVQMVANPAQEALHQARATAIEDAAREASGELVARPDLSQTVVRDESGPLTMFHGTQADFEKFREGTGWFTVDRGEARLYGGGDNARIRQANLDIRNPKYLEASETSPNEIAEALSDPKIDGVVMRDNGKVRWAVVRDPSQIHEFHGERRADAIEANRLAELRAKRTAGLTEAEKDELLTLQERDRLASKVGGRRIQGVQTDEAYAEMLARGEGKPVQGFVDMDMLKALNDTLGHGAGDDAIRTLGENLAHYMGEGNVFRRSSSGAGDEFIVQAESQSAYDSRIESARQHLSNHNLRAFDAEGNLIGEQKGIAFSHGSGKTVELAEQAAYADKQLRAAQGLRADRGTVPAKPAATGGTGGSAKAAGAKAGSKVSAAKATSELSNALRELAADPTNQSAHTAVRTALANIENSGLDAGAIERAAMDRAGDGGDTALSGAKSSERARIGTDAFDGPTREAVDQAQAILERRGEQPIAVQNEDGTTLPAREALNGAVDQLKNAQSEGELARIAAACFGRG